MFVVSSACEVSAFRMEAATTKQVLDFSYIQIISFMLHSVNRERAKQVPPHECENVRLPQRTIFFSAILFLTILFFTILLSQIYLLFNSFSTMPWHAIVPQPQTEGGDMPFSKYPKLLKVYLYEERRIGQKWAENTVRIPPKSCRDISVGIRMSIIVVNREGHLL